ncbi:hypothetical protein K8353_38085 [Burkholderia contaminans]|nr:hypothetical protein [Burkholderia contaminans]
MKNWKVAISVILGLVSVFVVSYMGAMIGGNGKYDRTVMASWLQAVGVFAAIAGGFAGVIYQAKIQSQQRAHDVRLREKELFTQILVTSNEAIRGLDTLSELLSQESFMKAAIYREDARRMTAQVKRTMSNLEEINVSISDFMRSSNVHLDHIRLLLRLKSEINKSLNQLIGVDDPYGQLSSNDVDFAPFSKEMERVRFEAGHYSVHI